MKIRSNVQALNLPNNCDLYSSENVGYYNDILNNYLPPIEKPLVFLPCACAQKTREKQEKRKRISDSMTHQLLSALTRDTRIEIVIVSEPLVLIPYALENRIPDYNLHPIQLSNEVKWEIIRRISHFLKNLKDKQPTRERIYYVGSKHHYEMLMTANNICNTIFELVSIIPFHGIRDYTKAAQSMREIIRENDRV